MTECEPHSPPAEQSAFSFAICPFHHERVDHSIDVDLPSPTHIDSSYEPFIASSPTQARKSTVGKDSVRHEVVPEQGPGASTKQIASLEPRTSRRAYTTSRRNPVVIMRRIQVQNMLTRCKVLDSRILSLECRPIPHKATALIQSHYETMEQLAHEAHSLAEGLKDFGLLQESESWARGARKGHEALNHFNRTPFFDQDGYDGAFAEVQAAGSTPKENKLLDVLLQKPVQRTGDKQTIGVADPHSPDMLTEQQSDTSSQKRRRANLLSLREELDAIEENLDSEEDIAWLEDDVEDGGT
jgi:hypothetical protein